ncbi:DUF805 domain-containing protein [Celeribacter indicus]|uniref:DUF805 domain-containing protein n=1 Tax=Celeribacter indicus TaxID=1208324 RepID=A0A0B5DSI2_9RHOB|nr:DUF805 domain-containing protein [Celeribacter indicus]AJE46009.1 hypothetical protein P73_1294 [Celeribacter indicus]SDX32762.1 Uncharacterized membrane protein YhaH, DUF805 family [Celeribacter indicus]
MTFPDAITQCFRKYAAFGGRASRSEYWWYTLFILLVMVALNVIVMLLFRQARLAQLLTQVFSLATFLPTLAVSWRRMHDSGRPGYLVMVWALGTFLGLLVIAVTAAIMVPDTSNPEAVQTLRTIGVATFAFCLVVTAIMIWWMTRRSDPAVNRFGPPST